MPGKTSLQRSARQAAPRLTLAQQRFGFLIGQIEKLRSVCAQNEAIAFEFQQDRLRKLQPLRDTFRTACRNTVLAIDGLLDEAGWSRVDRSALRQILCSTAGALLQAHGDDAELRALFDKHSTIDFDTVRQNDLQHLRETAEELTGIDLGDLEEVRSEEELVQRMYEEMAAREAAAESAKEARSRRRGKSAAQQRSEDNARSAKQALRELYRKLASAVHPDRESDPRRREEKNELMQRINRAYAHDDLMTLFETQMQLERIDASRIARLSTERLTQYNKLLSEQVATLKAAIREFEEKFRMEHGLAPSTALNPQRLALLMRRQARSMRAEIAQQQQFLGVLADKAATKRWLKQQRRASLRDEDLDDLSSWP